MSAPEAERIVSSAPRLDFASISIDVEALASMERESAGKQKPQVAYIERRLRDAGAHEIRSESFRFQRRWIWRHGVHAGAVAGGAVLGGPIGAALATAGVVSYELEVSGKSHWTARLLPGGEGTNVVARVPAAGPTERTIVFVAHHDAARPGLLWQRPLFNPRRPVGLVPELLMTLVALGCLAGSRLLRFLGGVGLGALALLGADVARRPVVPGANDNASGVAALLALVAAFARDPLDRTDVIAVFSDCEEVGQGGVEAWLAAHRGELDSATALVMSLDTLGSGRPAVVTRESPLLAVYPRETLDWADRGALRGAVAPPARTTLAATTDAIAARHEGLNALSLVSVDRDGTLGPDYHQVTDTPGRVDWDSVEDCTRLAAGVARVWDARD